MAPDIELKISLTTDSYRFELPDKMEWIALFDTVITITISVTLALLAIRLGVEMWLDSGYDS